MPATQQVVQAIDRFQDDQGNSWTWLQDAAGLCGIPSQTLYLWLKHPCSWIGRKLHPPRFREGMAGNHRRRRYYLLGSELKEICEAMARNCKPAPSRPEAVAPLAEIQKKIPTATLRRLLHGHNHPEVTPGGKGLWLDKLPARDKAGDVRLMWHARPAEVEEFVRHSSSSRSLVKSYTDEEGRVWHPRALVNRLYGIRPALLGVIRRSERKHPALGRTISYLKPAEVPTVVRGNKKSHCYLVADCQRIGEWLKRTTPLERAKDFLRTLLANGPVALREVKRLARQAGISWTTLIRAKRALRIKASRVGFQGTSYWHLPQDERPAAPLVSLPHPKLDTALQILRSVQDFEQVPFPELVQQAEQADVSRTALWQARDMLRRSVATGPVQPTPARPGCDEESVKPRRSGRPTSKETEEVLQFCYESYMQGTKLAIIREQARHQFKERAPKEDAHVTLFARRYAERKALPFGVRN